MLARRAQPVIERDLGRPAVRFGSAAGFELDQRRRLLRPGRDDAARAVVLETARDEADAVGEQGRGQRIAGMALVTFMIRYPVLAFLGKIPLPEPLFRALKYVPPAVLTAIVSTSRYTFARAAAMATAPRSAGPSLARCVLSKSTFHSPVFRIR